MKYEELLGLILEVDPGSSTETDDPKWFRTYAKEVRAVLGANTHIDAQRLAAKFGWGDPYLAAEFRVAAGKPKGTVECPHCKGTGRIREWTQRSK